MHKRAYWYVVRISLYRTALIPEQRMNGRFFDGRRIEAYVYAGKQRFKRSGTGDEAEGNSDEAEKQRLDEFAQWLMAEGD